MSVLGSPVASLILVSCLLMALKSCVIVIHHIGDILLMVQKSSLPVPCGK